jgi:hypothetical protein
VCSDWSCRKCARIGAAEIVELEAALAEGADHAVFGFGAGVDGQRHTRTGNETVAKAVLLTGIAVPVRHAVDATVEGSVHAQITADLDAGVGARDEEEAFAVERADPYIFDRLGFDRKVGRLCAPPRATRPDAELRIRFRIVFITPSFSPDTCRAGVRKLSQIERATLYSKMNRQALVSGCDPFATPYRKPVISTVAGALSRIASRARRAI